MQQLLRQISGHQRRSLGVNLALIGIPIRSGLIQQNIRPIPVSYTHLDVYKRQAVSSGILSLTGEDSFACLVDKIGADRALDAITLMEEAIGNIEKLCSEFAGQEIPGGDCGFRRMDCLRYTENEQLEGRIRQEYSLQLHNGFVAELLSPITASSQFTFPMAAGVYTKGAAGQVDPYRLSLIHI